MGKSYKMQTLIITKLKSSINIKMCFSLRNIRRYEKVFILRKIKKQEDKQIEMSVHLTMKFKLL